MEFDACAPVNKPAQNDGEVKASVIKAGKAVVAHYFGFYQFTVYGHDAAKKYINSRHKEISGPFWEAYVTDPGIVKDTAKWQTDIYFPVVEAGTQAGKKNSL
jgi:effector-binding domain-containing protein